MIKHKLVMDRIKIKVSDYYGNPSFYSVMPQTIFDALEMASLKGDEFIEVSKEQFDTMVESYKKKMECKD